MTEEWLGAWWRPGHDIRVGGQLQFTDRGPNLTLLGSLADWGDTDFSRGVGFPLSIPHKIPVIHGTSSRSLSVLGATCDFPKLPHVEGTETWHAEAVVEAHVGGGAGEPTFDGLRMELEGLPAWSRARGVSVVLSPGRRTQVTVEPHELATGTLASGVTVSIHQAAFTSDGALEYQIRQPVTLAVEGVQPTSWSSLLNDWLQPIQVLLWLAGGHVGRAEKLELPVPPTDPLAAKWARLWVSLVEPSGSSRSRYEFLFFAHELRGGFAEGLDSWFTLWSELRHILGPLYARASAPFA